MSVVLVSLPGAPQVCPEAQKVDKQLTDQLEKKVLGELTSDTD